MAFNPLYATDPTRNPAVDNAFGPGRPVNLRDIGNALMQPDPNATMGTGSPAPAFSGGPSLGDRVAGAVGSFGANLNPQSNVGVEAFFGSAARGFTGVRTYLQQLATGRTADATAREDRDLSRRRTEAQITTEGAQADYYKAGAEERRRPAPPQTAPTPAADRWEEVRDVPVGQPRLQRNTRTGVTKPVLDPSGRPMRVEARPVTPRGNRASPSPTAAPTTPAKTLSTEDYNLLRADGMTDQEMRDAGYTLP